MRRIKLIVAYDGTNYCGWQIQKNAITVEAVLNKAISSLTGEDIIVKGASRTDSGVHALGNVAVFDTESRIPPDKFCYSINQRLPEDIRVQHSEEVEMDFHPRYQQTVKTYEYKIYNSRINVPTNRLYSQFVYYRLDLEKMKEAATYIVGEHDFKSFCSANASAKTTVRTIYSLDIDKVDNMITMRITGNGFLYNMVRIIAGTLINVGTGMWEPEYVKDIMEKRDRQKAGPKAAAEGLTLIEIVYI